MVKCEGVNSKGMNVYVLSCLWLECKGMWKSKISFCFRCVKGELGVKVFLLGYSGFLCFCLSRNCFIIVSSVMRNHWVIVFIVVLYFCLFLFLLCSCTPSGILFDCLLCVLLSSGIVMFLSIILIVWLIVLIGESTFFRGCSLCTALHLLDDYRSIPLELEVCSLWSGFRGWNLCATECSCGYNRGFIEEL